MDQYSNHNTGRPRDLPEIARQTTPIETSPTRPSYHSSESYLLP